MVNFCELCGSEADFHCAADSAFLCHSCDAKFHTSNFLFARHFRRIICPICKSLTRDFVSGPLLPWPPMTSCCSTSSPSSASSCCSELSSTPAVVTTRKRKTRSRGKDERVKSAASGIFVDWCDKLGLNGDLRNTVVSLASFALTVERKKLRETKKKVFLAAAFWFGVKNSRKTMTCPTLKKVEDVTGIAARLIRAVESKLARAITLQLRTWRMDSEEGWAENDNV